MTFKKLVKNEDVAFSNIGSETHFALFNLFNPSNIYENQWKSGSKLGSTFHYLMKTHDLSVSELFYLLNADLITAAFKQFHAQKTL